MTEPATDDRNGPTADDGDEGGFEAEPFFSIEFWSSLRAMRRLLAFREGFGEGVLCWVFLPLLPLLVLFLAIVDPYHW